MENSFLLPPFIFSVCIIYIIKIIIINFHNVKQKSA
nr:MAG TPA: hypothetical protein [Caudoviricetes sp.]